MAFQIDSIDQRKNIVFVMNEYNGHGGVQKVTSTLANSFMEDGHRVEILSINESHDKFSYFDKQIPITVLHENGYRAPDKIPLKAAIQNRNFKKVLKELKRRRKVKKYVKKVDRYFDKFQEENVIVIVVQVWGMQWLTNLYYRKNVKIIGQSHESYFASRNSHRFYKIQSYYRMVDKFLLLSKKDVDLFRAQGFTNTDYVLNPSSFRSENNPEALYNNKRMVSVGRLIPEKGYKDLIKAFHAIHEAYPEWKLSIYGNGPSFKDLKRTINDLKLTEKVMLEGETNEIKKALESSSFFVLPSYAEGLPMVLIEAESCGLPCISTDCAPGIREIIDEYENGLIYPIGDVSKLSSQLVTLISNKEKFIEYSRKSYEKSRVFELNEIKKKWYDIFEGL